MIRLLSLLVIVSAGLLSVGSVVASDNPLEAVPDRAGVLLRLRSPQSSLEKVAALAGKIDRQHAQAVRGAMPELGTLISNPDLQGVDAESDWWVAVFPHADRDPGVLFIVPASDADALEAAVKTAGDYRFVRHGRWVMYTEDASTAEALSQRAAGEGQAFTGVLDEQSLALMDGAELSLFINVPQLRTAYRAQIDRARQGVDQFLDQLARIQVQNAGFNMQPIVDMYARLFHGLLQALEDAEGFTAAVMVGDDGVTVEELARFASGSASAEFVEASQPSELKRLEALPADHLAYMGGHFDMQGMLTWSMEVSAAMLKNDPQKQRELIEGYRQLTYGDFVASFNVGDADSGILRAVTLWEVRPAEKMRELAQTFGEQMQVPTAPGMTMEIKYESNAEEYGERSADVMTMKQTLDPGLDPQGTQRGMMQAMFGPDGMVSRTVYLEGAMLQTQGGGRELMTEALKALDEPPGLQDAAAATRARLSDKANFLAVFDVPRITARGFVAIARSGIMPEHVDPTPVERLELAPSYAGFSITTEARGLRCRTYVPVEQARGMLALVQAFQSMRRQP